MMRLPNVKMLLRWSSRMQIYGFVENHPFLEQFVSMGVPRHFQFDGTIEWKATEQSEGASKPTERSEGAPKRQSEARERQSDRAKRGSAKVTERSEEAPKRQSKARERQSD